MIKHVVMFKLKDNSVEQKKILVDKFLGMKGKIDVLVDLEAGYDIVMEGRSFDVILICTFKSLDDLNIYADHPVHVPVKNYIKGVAEKSHAVDFEF